MLNKDYKDSFEACSAQALMENRSKIRLRKEQERRERIDDAVEVNRKSSLHMFEELKALVESVQEQNRILQSQIDETEKKSEEAKRESRKSRIFSWISFGVATVIAIISLIISCVQI
ncbi:MAG: hypothetical protein IJD45_01655 [Clostridia bacterium]|nr:hypothetical protein [Clostridia bacterium]